MRVCACTWRASSCATCSGLSYTKLFFPFHRMCVSLTSVLFVSSPVCLCVSSRLGRRVCCSRGTLFFFFSAPLLFLFCLLSKCTAADDSAGRAPLFLFFLIFSFLILCMYVCMYVRVCVCVSVFACLCLSRWLFFLRLLPPLFPSLLQMPFFALHLYFGSGVFLHADNTERNTRPSDVAQPVRIRKHTRKRKAFWQR